MKDKINNYRQLSREYTQSTFSCVWTVFTISFGSEYSTLQCIFNNAYQVHVY